MSPRITLATARRVLWQIRRDRRTIALLLVVPVGLLVLMRYVFDGQPSTFQAIGAPMCGLFPFIIMFLVTSIAMLRERTSGTLERLMSLPLAKTDLLAGYGIAFGLLAALQALVVCLVGFLYSACTPRTAHGSSGCSPSATPYLAWRSACSSARSPAPSSRPCSSCPRSFSPSYFYAGCS